MKTLIAYFSVSGNNTLLAEHLGKRLGAPVEPIRINGVYGMFRIMMSTLFSTTPGFRAFANNPADFDLVIVCGPVWISHFAAPMRSFLKRYKKSIKKFAVATCYGGQIEPKNDTGIPQLEKIAGQSCNSFLSISIEAVATPEEKEEYSKNLVFHLKEESLNGFFKPAIDEFIAGVSKSQ